MVPERGPASARQPSLGSLVAQGYLVRGRRWPPASHRSGFAGRAGCLVDERPTAARRAGLLAPVLTGLLCRDMKLRMIAEATTGLAKVTCSRNRRRWFRRPACR